MKKLSRKAYIKEYKALGKKMFSECTIPTVATFANAYANNNKEALEEIEEITSFTKNIDDIEKSVKRRNDLYSEQESKKFMDSVISANVSDITDSGHFYKKLMSSADDMIIIKDDCKSKGEEITLPIDEDTFDYKIRNRFVVELDRYVDEYKELPKSGTIHVRTFLSCKCGERKFCKKCAGQFRRSYDTSFTPKYIGLYSTLMITEHATQASLDSMNKNSSDKVNVILERNDDTFNNVKSLNEAKDLIRDIIDEIGNIGVQSRFYEIALLSRWRDNEFKPLQTSFTYQDDIFGTFIYSSSPQTFKKLITAGTFKADSVKTKIAFDNYDTGGED